MADYLIPYIEFLGLPGSGKSYYSHKVAVKLRGEGYKIAEPSWDLDHSTGKYARAFKKMMMAWLFTMCHRHKAAGIKDVIRKSGLSKTEVNRFQRNIMYKAYLLSKKNESILFFDEGLAQMAVSLSVSTDKSAGRIYNEVLTTLSQERKALLIRIDCSIETALLNMDTRTTHDSYVERLAGLELKKDYLGRYKTECESIIQSNALVVPYSQNDSMVVTTIAEYLKFHLNKEK